MKIIEHKFRPGTICFHNVETGKRSYWFSASSLFEGLIDNEQAVDIIMNWSVENINKALQSMAIEEGHWVDYAFDYEPVIAPAGK